MTDPIVECLKGFISKEFDDELDVSKIDAETPLFDGGLELDSFAIVRIISLVEAHFGFEFAEDDLCAQHFGSISALGRLVAAKTDGQVRPQ